MQDLSQEKDRRPTEEEMIIFEFDTETHDSDGALKTRPVYWLGSTMTTGYDKEHSNEIYEQLDCEQAFGA